MVVWFFIEIIIYGILGWKFVSWETAQSIKNFFPLESMWNLIKEPFTRHNAVRSAANTMGETFTKSYSVDFTNILIVSCWTFIFIFLSYKLLLKRDL